MINLESFLKELLKNTRKFKAPSEKAQLYAVTKDIIGCYFREFNFNLYKNAQVGHSASLEYSVAALRAKFEKHHSNRIHSFFKDLKSGNNLLLKSYKKCLSRVSRYTFHSSPISHLKYGLKTAESFFWKMSLFARLNNVKKECVDRLARLLASQSLEVLLLFDGLLWDRLQFFVPTELVVNGNIIFIEGEKAESIATKLNRGALEYGPLGCPALAVRIAGRPLMDFLSDSVWGRVSEYFDR